MAWLHTNARASIASREISRLYSKLTSNQILCSSGAGKTITFHCKPLVSPGDHAIVFTPCYQSLMELPKLFGADVTEIPLDENEGWRFDLDKVRTLSNAIPGWSCSNFPHNPTGSLPDKETFFTLIDMAAGMEPMSYLTKYTVFLNWMRAGVCLPWRTVMKRALV